MNLRKYLDELPPGGVSAFAKQLGIARVYLSQLAAKDNNRQPSPALSWKIERATNGKVTRRDLRSDWKVLWPDLERRRGNRDEKAGA